MTRARAAAQALEEILERAIQDGTLPEELAPEGCPYPEIAKIVEIFSDVVETPYTIASWILSPQDLLEGETPIAWLRAGKDSSRILAAAQRSAGELSL